MPKIPEPTPSLNRLRAAAGLLPMIESGLADSKLSRDRAALMADFCSWAVSSEFQGEPEAERLAADVREGLDRVSALLSG